MADRNPSDMPTEREGYSDAAYTAVGEEHPHYIYSPNHSYTAVGGDVKTDSRRAYKLSMVAICLVCALLAFALGVGGTLLLTGKQDAEPMDLLLPAEEESETAAAADSVKPVLVTNSTLGEETMSPEDIYTMACGQVVGISTEISYLNVFGQKSGTVVSGTGFVITEDGYILTNYHVIEDAYTGGFDVSVLTFDGTEYAAEVAGVEADSDIAVLKIDASGLDPVTLGDFNEVQVGQTVYTVGNPLGELSYTMTAGIVSAADRSIQTEADTAVNMFQINAAVNEGNSGGPIYNDCGQVIGIVTAKYSAGDTEGLGFGIPISDAHYVANELITNGYVSGKAYMGIRYGTVSASAARYYNMVEGALVQYLEADSCADEAGLQLGDIITAVGETEITDAGTLATVIKKYHAGDTAQLTVFRAQEYLSFTITFDEATGEDISADTSGEMGSASGETSASGEMTVSYTEEESSVGNGVFRRFFNPLGE